MHFRHVVRRFRASDRVMKDPSPYSAAFYAGQVSGSVSSAKVVVPHLIEAFVPASVVDIGCGTGAWLAEFADQGTTDILGLDGAWVDMSSLRIPPERFQSVDLEEPIVLERSFDLCLCLEVAEHLPASRAPAFVGSLTSLAPIVVFSAAIPGQTGVNHVNERWPSYWRSLFEQRGFRVLDCIRPLIWDRSDVQWWYAQNLVVYVSDTTLARRPELSLLASQVTAPFDLVHPTPWKLVAEAMAAEQASVFGRLRRLRRRMRSGRR